MCVSTAIHFKPGHGTRNFRRKASPRLADYSRIISAKKCVCDVFSWIENNPKLLIYERVYLISYECQSNDFRIDFKLFESCLK